MLQGEGLVEKIHGSGNFVRRPPRKIMYVGGWGTLDPWTAAETALRVTVRTSTVPAQGHLTTLLKVPTGSPLAEFFCVSHEGESPHGLARIYIPCDLAPAGVLGDGSSWRETATRFALLTSAPAAVRETVCARRPNTGRSIGPPGRIRRGSTRRHTRRHRHDWASRRGRASGVPGGSRRRNLHYPPRDR